LAVVEQVTHFQPVKISQKLAGGLLGKVFWLLKETPRSHTLLPLDAVK
jgi:hypothetical protein